MFALRTINITDLPCCTSSSPMAAPKPPVAPKHEAAPKPPVPPTPPPSVDEVIDEVDEFYINDEKSNRAAVKKLWKEKGDDIKTIDVKKLKSGKKAMYITI